MDLSTRLLVSTIHKYLLVLITEKGIEVRRGGRITVTCQDAVRVYCCRRNDSELTSGPSNAKSITSLIAIPVGYKMNLLLRLSCSELKNLPEDG